MSNSPGPIAANDKPRSPPTSKTAERDAEDPPQTATTVTSIVWRWEREDLLEKARFALRAAACALSLLAFVVMASNRHGSGKDFKEYEEYKYLVAIAVLSFLYAAAQLLLQAHRVSTGRELMSRLASARLDFGADQLMAYLLMSALSAAIPMTNRIREGADNIFTDSSAASISMAFLAFLALALSAMISGFKLSNQTYV
ncbi:CASP-like protein [Acorus gramineus]|uniref:CASP-like protein n=1 Tax=Acorus gramineus TaxID=55184 RepID=A0AAV9AMA2_ACOGR|nr:CASP-like protein [Acorus gramineus]